MPRVMVIALLLASVPMATMASATVAPAPSVGATGMTDGAIARDDLRHLPDDEQYRSPTGVVEAGTLVRLRLRSAAGDLSGAQAFFRDRASGDSWLVEMDPVMVRGHGTVDGYDYWQAEVETRPFPMVLDYGFVARDGTMTCWLFAGGVNERDGASGDELSAPVGWRLTFDHPDIGLPAPADRRELEAVYRDAHATGDASSCLLPRPELPHDAAADTGVRGSGSLSLAVGPVTITTS